MNNKKDGLKYAFFFCQQLDAAQDLNRRSLEKELGPRIRFFPLPCSGRIESLHLLRALESGVDKVYVITCPKGACRHQEGNTRAGKRAAFAQRLISEFGLEPDRIEFMESPTLPSPSIEKVARELLSREIRIQPLPWATTKGRRRRRFAGRRKEMITAERKPLAEIKESIAPYKKLLILGCGSCVAECASGGEKETALLASQLRIDAKKEGRTLETKEMTLDRQCVYEFIDQLAGVIGEYDAVLSLGCGAGVQAVAEVFPRTHIVPALNTTFIGQTKQPGLWLENCRGCGDCKLDSFADVCPVTRCSKGLFNGPCGGSKDEKCEVDPDTPCAWQLIVTRLEERGKLDSLEKVHPPARWSKKEGKGPRKIAREDQRA